ncbi:MAG: MFS transporter [Chloroflexi bacterium]|nr:MFS transporter [Chloroflexota bacterium]
MLTRLRLAFSTYPRQFWLLAAGVLISSTGSSIIWPFQLIYASQALQQPIAAVASLVSVSSFAGMLVSFLGGSIADRFGRKPVMFAAILAHGLGFFLMSRADTYLGFLLPMTVMGAAMPFHAVGSDAMLADMIPSAERNRAYSILRMSSNAGIAIGPAIGGFIVSKSYTLAFYGAAGGMLLYSLILLFLVRETLARGGTRPGESLLANLADYKRVLADRRYIRVVAAVTFGMIAPLMMWTLFAVYTKTNFGLPEYLYSWLPITNALMCVFVQYFVTLFTRKHEPLRMAALGMFVYALGVGSVALMGGFGGFWVSMVILTFGELILIPTGTTYAANRAPADLRGRYMTIYWFTWGLARAAAPLVGGFLNDAIAPRAIWIGGLIIGTVSTVLLLALARGKETENENPGKIEAAGFTD